MNMYTRHISYLLKITLEDALKVQDAMSGCGFRFSEATHQTINVEAIATYKALKIMGKI